MALKRLVFNFLYVAGVFTPFWILKRLKIDFKSKLMRLLFLNINLTKINLKIKLIKYHDLVLNVS